MVHLVLVMKGINCTKANYLEEFHEHYDSYHPVYYGTYAWDNNWVWSGYDLPKLYWQN